ncbi:GH92 family glycosyl hydrolase [Nemorincola caseinilytica]|uniref:GH92 family glycosyl hydrolase n=1 Tax=Nemorincola caseinilytica TaxID=2054315 RepID=A0ABP8NHL7_9BACT
MLSINFRNSLLFVILALTGYAAHAQRLTRYIDPFIGTGGHGHTFPGACVPFGMVQLSPDNGSQGWDWCSGYNYSDNVITGFSHMHLSGTGCGDWTDISVMPLTAPISDTSKFFRVSFDHKNEKASAGYYYVRMDNGISVGLTATERCGLHSYMFPKGVKPLLRFHLTYMMNWDSATHTYIKYINDSTITGYRMSRGWARTQRVYFAARVSAPIRKMYTYDNNTHQEVGQGNLNDSGRYNGVLEFAEMNGRPLMMKVALSNTSMDKALLALGEIPGWNFEKVRTAAEAKWEAEMAKMEVTTSDEKLKRIFYTALYHTCIAPSLYSDADGQYQNANGDMLRMKKGQRYTVFSLWDTFRGLHPLFTITQQQRLPDLMNSMMAFCDETGLLPVWDLSTFETNCMSGYHAVPVLADAVLKNTPGIDAEKALECMKKSAMQNIRGTQWYRRYGYVPQDSAWQTVTKTLEYAYDDWCIAQVAKKLGKTADHDLYMKKAAAYKLLFDKETGFIRARNSDGKWTEPFDPYFTSTDGSKSFYEEGNAWQYTFFVPHDIRGLAKGYGSYDRFTEMLDKLFSTSSEIKGEQAPPDVSGLIGQYAHGNEPSHHIAYMYSYVGQSWKTQKWARTIIDSMYHDHPEGYSGNEDCGQMSAWGVLSMAGFYPANASGGEYVFGSPVFDEVRIKLPGGKTMKIATHNNGKDACYIQSVTLNGKPYTRSYISHTTLMQGGELVFEMGTTPNKQFGKDEKDWPSSVN